MQLCKCTIVNYSRYTAPVACGARAHIERGGHWYCGRHDPVARERARQRTLKANQQAVQWRRALRAG